MPLPSEMQNFMATFLGGLVPGLNSKGQIANLAALLQLVAKTANYTAKVEESGTIFHTTGATGAVVITLPAAKDAEGCFFGFVNTVDQSCGIAAAADTLVYDGDATATSLTWSTANHKIGGACFAVSNGAKWLVFVAGNGSAVPTAA